MHFIDLGLAPPKWRRSISHFGGLRIQTDSEEGVASSAKKTGALLAYLALYPGQAQAWPRDSLREALSLLHKALSLVDPRALIAHQDTITFEPTVLSTDAIVSGDRVAQEEAELGASNRVDGGELLDGFQVRAPEFKSWVTAEGERFWEMAPQAMTTLLEHLHGRGRARPWHRGAAT